MENYLKDLLKRMTDPVVIPEGSFSSEDSISWKAYREAENLTDVRYIPLLMSIISTEKNANIRKSAYFTLGKIAKNTQNNEATQFIINRIAVETSESVLENLFSSLKGVQKSENIDISPILELIKNEKMDISVKKSAVFALRGTKNPEAEAVVLALSEKITDETDFAHWYINNTLADIGTRKSIPRLTQLAYSKKMDNSAAAIGALIDLGDERELPIFEELIQQGRNKPLALLALTKRGNENHIPLIINRLKEVVSRKRNIITIVEDDNQSELMVGMKFLLKYADRTPEIKKLYELLTTKKWGNLFEEEQKFLSEIKM